MAKAKKMTAFFCTECGFESSKWQGQCPMCKAWNTMVEEPVRTEGPGRIPAAGKRGGSGARPVPLSSVKEEGEIRLETGFRELDRVLGGGIVAGSLTLLGGDPGIGKSTLLLQAAKNLTDAGHEMLYVSGEESVRQIKLRASRIGMINDHLKFLCETDLGEITQICTELHPEIVIIDSIQTMYNDQVQSAPGSVSQVRETTGILLRLAKETGITFLIIGHVTKEGTVAGPRVLEHMVDTVLYFEGDRYASYRILRGVKNRFGSTNEIGIFEMGREGLTEVEDPSEFMLSGRPVGASGAVVTCSVEGTRPLLAEVQALVTKSNFGFPKRQANGTDYNRVGVLMAVLEKRLGIPLSEYDAYVNLTGGIRQKEPAMDLGIVMAILSSFRNHPVPDQMIAFGEVGLSGEVRGVSQAEQRVQEAAKMGFTICLLPKSNMGRIAPVRGIRMIGIENIREAGDLLQ